MQWIEPMECLTAPLPDGTEWAYEVKWDGYRAIGSADWLLSRRAKWMNFPFVRDALRQLDAGTILDGEVVAFDESGRPSFNQLQNHRRGSLVYYYAFDILSHRGKSLLKMKWHERRAILARALPSHPLLHLSASLESEAKTVIKAITEMNLEGVIAKRRESCYEPGKRTGAWIKHRLLSGQEFVIGGFTPGAHAIDAIVVGYYEGDRLIFVARTRNGFVPSSRRRLFERLKTLITKKCPFANLPEPRSYRWGEGLTEEKMAACVWVKPEVVAQINYVNWTDANHLRHSSFVGIREDKRARDVIKEYAHESSLKGRHHFHS